jgi:hypothetical protein
MKPETFCMMLNESTGIQTQQTSETHQLEYKGWMVDTQILKMVFQYIQVLQADLVYCKHRL